MIDPTQCIVCPARLDYNRVVLGLEKDIKLLSYQFDTYEAVMYGKFIEDIINRFGLPEDDVYAMLENRQEEAREIIQNYKG